MSKGLLAKDKRRWNKRKGIVAAAWIGGGLALAGLGYYLYRKLIYDVKTTDRKDWSGCFDPPAWVTPRPLYSCAQRVTSQTYYGEGAEAGVDGTISGRTWTSSGSTEGGDYLYGTWQYSILFSDDIYEEGQLTEA